MGVMACSAGGALIHNMQSVAGEGIDIVDNVVPVVAGIAQGVSCSRLGGVIRSKIL